jgi:hypothetical protein
VPGELKDIFQGSMRPVLASLLGQSDYREWNATVACGDESLLAPLLREVSAGHGAVYVKSRARVFSSEGTFQITLSALGSAAGTAQTLLEAAWADLARALEQAGVPVLALERT